MKVSRLGISQGLQYDVISVAMTTTDITDACVKISHSVQVGFLSFMFLFLQKKNVDGQQDGKNCLNTKLYQKCQVFQGVSSISASRRNYIIIISFRTTFYFTFVAEKHALTFVFLSLCFETFSRAKHKCFKLKWETKKVTNVRGWNVLEESKMVRNYIKL